MNDHEDDGFNEPFLNNLNSEGNFREDENQNIENNSQRGSILSNDFMNDEDLERQNMSFLEKVSSKEMTDILNDIGTSLFFIILLLFPLYYSPQYCDKTMYISMNILIWIYTGFILRALLKSLFIHFNKDNKLSSKIFLMSIGTIISLSYYICIYLSYIIYSQSNSQCFKTDTLTIFSFFSAIFVGMITFAQKIVNLILLTICVFLMIDSFISNPSYFFSHYGVDPDFIKNLPTIKADDKHVSTCVICVKDIAVGDEILILNCPGRHYFHGDCIKRWLLVKSICPMCRSEHIL